MGTFRAWLRLIRVAALPTALADVWLGAAVASGFWTWRTVPLSILSLCLYAAGMILNDVHDVDADRHHNPSRPLPTGEIKLGAARLVGFGLLFAAAAGAAFLGPVTFAVAAALALLILGYNFLSKPTPLGPLNMGLCRGANVLLGLTVVPDVLTLGVFVPILTAAPIVIYITIVTSLARRESESGRIRRAVRSALIGIIPFQAALLAFHGRNDVALCTLFLLIPVFLLKPLSHIT